MLEMVVIRGGDAGGDDDGGDDDGDDDDGDDDDGAAASWCTVNMNTVFAFPPQTCRPACTSRAC